MTEEYLFLCADGCGSMKLKDMKPDPKRVQNMEDYSLCCSCGSDVWYIVPNDKKEED